MPEALIALGSNVEPERNLPAAIRSLALRLEVRSVSSAWATPPVGPPGQPPFLNAAALVATSLAPGELKSEVLREVEQGLGRVRTADPFAPRPIDLDLVLWAPRLWPVSAMAREGLEVLDPDLAREPHLAVPAAEILPAWIHPATGEALSRLAERLVASLPLERQPRRSAVALQQT